MCGWYHMNYECSEIRIGIRDISSEDNSVTIQRMAGGSDVTLKDVKISVNGKEKLILSVVKYDNPSLLELETKTYVLDYDVQSGDRIQVAPIIDDKGDEMTCGIIASAKAP